jgi:ankyrin repeat protein
VPSVVSLLLQHGADIDATNNSGETPLHRAVYWGKVEVVRALLENGANVEAKNNEGQTPIQVAREQDEQDIVQILLEHGAEDADLREDSEEDEVSWILGCSHPIR